MSFRLAALIAASCFLYGCSHSFSTKILQETQHSAPFHEIRSNPDAFTGRMAMVGGVIAAVHSTPEGAVMEIAQLDLSADKVPNDMEATGGRFLATSPDFAITAECTPGRLVTIAGEVKGKRVQKREKATEVYPVIAIREMQLWNTLEPERSPVVDSHFDPYYWGYPTEQYLHRPIGTKLKR